MQSPRQPFESFTSVHIRTIETTIFARYGGQGPPILLLHGFPETHLMWRDIAGQLTERFSVVCADLRGYGASGCPPTTGDHSPYSKRAMARDMISLMEQLGHTRFSVAGHDRGGRVAYRMALDHGDRIAHVAVLDVLPTETVWEHADARFALGFWPWSLLAQPEPLPESILAACADAIVASALSEWGSRPNVFPEDIRKAYAGALRDPAHAHAVCEEYRAAATVDRDHDRADIAGRHLISCPLLALWSATGPLATWYEDDGGVLELWREWAVDVRGRPVQAGHFFPEEVPAITAAELQDFFETPVNS